MSNGLLLLLLAICLMPVSALAQETPKSKKSTAEAAKTPATLPDWGELVDLAKDCRFTAKEKDLTILVPGRDRPHDFSAELDNIDAPRVLLQQTGDFTMEVKVDGSFSPGAESTQASRTGYIPPAVWR